MPPPGMPTIAPMGGGLPPPLGTRAPPPFPGARRCPRPCAPPCLSSRRLPGRWVRRPASASARPAERSCGTDVRASDAERAPGPAGRRAGHSSRPAAHDEPALTVGLRVICHYVLNIWAARVVGGIVVAGAVALILFAALQRRGKVWPGRSASRATKLVCHISCNKHQHLSVISAYSSCPWHRRDLQKVSWRLCIEISRSPCLTGRAQSLLLYQFKGPLGRRWTGHCKQWKHMHWVCH